MLLGHSLAFCTHYQNTKVFTLSVILSIVNVKCKCKFNVKHRECLRDHPSQKLMMKCLTIIRIELEFGNVGF